MALITYLQSIYAEEWESFKERCALKMHMPCIAAHHSMLWLAAYD